MFSYYGSKSKIIHYYPQPKFERIIEPFAGSARYACLYYMRDVWINDKYDVIYRIWKWIQQATRHDIQSLPELQFKDDLRNIKTLSDEERLLVGFTVARGSSRPNNIVTRMAKDVRFGRHHTMSAMESLKSGLNRLAGRINHWKITNLDYNRIGNVKATWFIDPPYQVGGDGYKVNDVDYKQLMAWIKSRRGETITCENTNNTWLKGSKPLVRIQGAGQTMTTEVMRYACDR